MTNSDQPIREESRHIERPILFFDGVCGLCNATVDWVMSRDTNQRIAFSPLQGETAQQHLPANTLSDLKTVVLLDSDGIYKRSSAIVRILRHLGGRYSWLGGLLWIIPRPLRDAGYALVASNRYRMFGKRDACRMPTPDERARILP